MSWPTQVAAAGLSDKADQIYRKAAEIITRKGFDATSMNDIAKAVDLTKAGLYYYIRGKRDLLYAIVRFAMDSVEQNVIHTAREIDDPEERLESIVTCHARLLVAHGGAVTILTEEMAGLSPEHRAEMIVRKREYLDFVRGTLKELRNEGKLRNVDVTVASLTLFATILGIARWYRPEGRLSGDQVVSEVSNFVLGGLLATKRRATTR